ncbi:MAG: putative Ig domain-containing protein, partial [Thermomonas sp.]
MNIHTRQTSSHGASMAARLLGARWLTCLVALALWLGCAGTVLAQSITLSPTTVPPGTVGVPYSVTITASGGTAPYIFSVNGPPSLPAGLILDPATGVISGTPTGSGGSTVTIVATDSSGLMGQQSYFFSISSPTITLSPTSVPLGTVGVPYSVTITASGGTGPYTYLVGAGPPLPAGLILNPATGVISGTPTVEGVTNSFIQATDSFGSVGGQIYTFQFVAPVVLSPTTLPSGTVGAPYSQTFTASGGFGGYTFAVSAGTLPAGLTFINSTGNQIATLSGTPTAVGTSNFTVTITDGPSGFTDSQTYTVTIVGTVITL